MDSGFQVLDSGFYPYWNPDSKTQKIPDLVSGLLLIFAFRFLETTSMADLVIEGHVCESMFVYLYFHNNI